MAKGNKNWKLAYRTEGGGWGLKKNGGWVNGRVPETWVEGSRYYGVGCGVGTMCA